MNAEIYLNKFMDEYHFRLEQGTIKLYIRAMKQLLEYTGKRVEEITRRDIKGWLNALNQKGLKAITVYTKIVGVKQFYRFCLEEGIIMKDPAERIDLPHIEEKVPHYLTREQLNQLRKHVEWNTKERAIVEVLYATGMRISELVAMKKEDIYWEERMIIIPKGKRKKERFVLFTRECAEHLKAYLEERYDDLPYVFISERGNNSICTRTIQKRFEEYTEKLGFKLSPHTLRHTFAAHLAQKGMKLECIQELLGHDSPYQTHLYAKLYDQARKEMYDEWM